MENQLGALGLGLNAITWWNGLYLGAAVDRLEASGLAIGPQIRARLSPLLFEHINFHGSHPFHRPDLHGRLREVATLDAEPGQ
ncbi:Tn3 family transposase [Nonomuraea sp. NPDC052116]|uniref:Tn3 family transposase n=1 Tax=Nonomuraea sp. NPDC052116 TaxID=3155665 RepID=UPI00343B5503